MIFGRIDQSIGDMAQVEVFAKNFFSAFSGQIRQLEFVFSCHIEVMHQQGRRPEFTFRQQQFDGLF
ncbi:hypothetical protein SDC9_143184 [bioreactor metagenome]|uniref:Uncharacterized protein n=1 Tax=bioreactor metagenome TaxID=1076179 RepID=A0A645E3P8_9ZZZZ